MLDCYKMVICDWLINLERQEKVVETIYSHEDLLKMMDQLLKEKTRFDWDQFYLDRDRNVPFFSNQPDENLVEYFDKGLFVPGSKVLELGCGPGRNAIFFAEKGCHVDAVDSSEESLKWGRERAKENGLTINFIHKNIFDLAIDEGSYDIVFDSGCFHHIAPHRRGTYNNLVKRALKTDGLFGITCFLENGKYGGSDITDWDVYRFWSLKGGLGFTDQKLRDIFKDLKEIEIRNMRQTDSMNGVFAEEGFLTAIFKK